jgi:hyaluronoglucosaminidase
VDSFRFRGVIEGFYGTPWSHEDRLWLLARMGELGLNTYVYAPKGDPLHLERWREPYPEDALARFRELVREGDRAGVDVGFAVSPGRSIVYASAEDRARLRAKLEAFRGLGSRFLCIALDDVPSSLLHDEDRARYRSLAQAHVELLEEIRTDLPPEVALWLVPTDYLGVEPTEYLETLGAGLPRDVEIGWTGRTVLSPEIRSDEAARRAATLGRKLLVWDNTPVADGPMRRMLHLSPYVGRDPDLAADVSGILLNPMEQPRASLVTVSCAAEYLRDPCGYDAEVAWQRAIDRLGGEVAPTLRVFAAAHRFSPLRIDDRDAELEGWLERLRATQTEGAARLAILDELDRCVARRLAVPDELACGLADRHLHAEIAPWIESHARETRRIERALRVLRARAGGGSRSAVVLAYMGMEAAFTREIDNGKASYGPRRLLYPQLVSMRDDEMRFGTDPCLLLDRCLADEFVRLAAIAVLGDRMRR